MYQHKNNYEKGHIVTKVIRGLHSSLDEDIRMRAANLPVSPAGFRILWVLNYYNKMIMSDLSFFLQLNISSISRQLLKLENEKFIFIESGEDARKKQLCLTNEGKKLIEKVIKEDGSSPKYRMLELLDDISKEDFETFLHVGVKLCEHLLGNEYLEPDLKAGDTY